MIYNWKYIDNQFLLSTYGSIKRAVILSTFHDNALRTLSTTYPLLLPLYTRYHPLHLALVAAYNQHTSSGSLQQGDRLSVTQEFAISKKLLTNVWMPVILGLHPKDSPRYKAIFPGGLSPFNTGTIDTKIAAFGVLGTNIGSEVALASIKTAADSNYASLLLLRETQSSAITTTSDDSDTLETARIAAMVMQYRNLGNMMDNFYDTIETMCPLVFDLVTLRENPQTIFTGAILSLAQENLLAHTFLAADQIAVKIVGSGTFNLYLSSGVAGVDSTPILITANIKQTITISAFGVTNYALHRFLNVVSLSGDTATYRVQLL